MGLKADVWNRARTRAYADVGFDRTTIGYLPDAGTTHAKYMIDETWDPADHDGEDQPTIKRYQPVWLEYPNAYYAPDEDDPNSLPAFNLRRGNRIPRVSGWQRFDDFGASATDTTGYPIMAVSRRPIKPGEIGLFVIEGMTLAICYAQRLVDNSIHQHLRLNWFAQPDPIFDYRPTDPPTVVLDDGRFTPYYADNNDNPLRARLLWRNVLVDLGADDPLIDATVEDIGIVILPAFVR